MQAYLTYEEYHEMGGLLEQAAFARWAAQAARSIDRITQGRVKAMETISAEIKRLVFELIALASAVDPLNPAQYLTQETEIVDGVHSSRIYSPGRMDMAAGGMERLIVTYLDGMADDAGVPLLYLGV
jgi:hypothetical protein